MKRFSSTTALVQHQMRSKGGTHGIAHPVFRCVQSNVCPVCSTALASRAAAKQHLKLSYLSGYCKMDLALFDWPPDAMKSWSCHQCQPPLEFSSLAAFNEHLVGTHLPQPIPVPSSYGPPAGGAHRHSRRGNGREENSSGRAAKKSKGEGKKKQTGGNDKTLLKLLCKSQLNSMQSIRELQGVLFDCVQGEASQPEFALMSEQSHAYQLQVSKAGKGHNLGPPHRYTFAGLLAALCKRGQSVGALNAQSLQAWKEKLEKMRQQEELE
eukprot:350227-Amphidinium_carterae.1